MKKSVVALVGRPNVGKSTLFNRLVGSKMAIIEDIPGITRDRLYGNVKFENYSFHLIDTGGIDISDEKFNDEIKIQAEIAINEADVIVFATPIYFYTICGQLKTLIDRCCAMYTRIVNKEFYYIMTAADVSQHAMDRAVIELQGFLYCLSGAEEKGIMSAREWM